tara:strand:- start:8582 stop:9982 length:1401 start_codon:yes stop_codon:yes gene_type:complete
MKTMTAIFCWAISCALFAQNLELEKYLDEVKRSNESYKALKLRSKSLNDLSAEADLIYSSKLESSLYHVDNSRPNSSPSTLGVKTTQNTASIAVSKPTSYGVEGSVSYNVANTEIDGASSTVIPENKYYENYAELKISQSLYRNFLGREIKSKDESIRKSAKAGKAEQDFKMKNLLSDAENIYYQYIIAGKRVQIQEAAKERAESLAKWTLSKTKKNLADNADYLQAESALQSRELDLLLAKHNLRSIAQIFNSLRGVNSSVISEKVELSIVDHTKNLTAPQKNEFRLDTLAIKYSAEAEMAQAIASSEVLKPDLKLNGSAAFYGKTNGLSDATSDSFGSKNPVYSIGLSLSMPLDFSAKERAQSAYLAKSQAAQLEVKRKEFDDAREWEDLLTSFEELKDQLKVYNKLEEIQRRKAINERKRQKNGLSTTFQVLSFEQEYLSTLSLRLSKQAELIQTYTQLKLFN